MLDRPQEQRTAEGSVAIQAAGNVTVTSSGLTYSEVRQAALDVFHANFYRLAGVAADVATSRAQEITEEFLSKLQKEAPAGIENAQDPDFQYALFTVQREYARTGDKNLGDLLVDLLVDRSKHRSREILQIVLNEALNTAPKLTESQLAALAVDFVFKYTQNLGINNHHAFGTCLDRLVMPFIEKIVKNLACYQHLEFCGCGSISIAAIPLEKCIGTAYEGLFYKGFSRQEVVDRGINIGPDASLFIPCLNDPSRLQVDALNQDGLDQKFTKFSIDATDREKINDLLPANRMSHAEIREKTVSIRGYMGELFDKWSGSQLQNLSLTSVGIAIGHANVKRFAGEFADLAIWIN
jgi:hypothetical protein